MKNRKLFPTANPTNATECFGDCEPISGIIYSQPPPPPPPLPLPSPLVVPNQADQSHGLSPSVIVLVTLLGSFSLLVGYYVVVSKACFGLCKRRNRSENPPPSDGGDEELVDDNHGVDHPIWFITTVGLQQSMINSITVVKYKRNEGLIEGTECSVCLNEFRENETLRLLPKCSHAFHTPCIDTWLRSHTNCPLCRAHIVSDSNTNRRLEPGNRNGGGGDGIEEAQMGNNSQNGNGQRVDQDGTNSNNNNNSNGSCVLEGGNDNGEMAGNDQVRLMRSVSVDSSSSWLVIAKKIGEMEENHVLGRSNREVGQKQCLRMSPVVMKRSLSCGGRFLSSRPNQRLNSVLLPL